MRRKILEYIVACQRERNFPPTIREIAAHVGLNAPATVANHIEVLKKAGYIEKNPKQPRTLTVHLDAHEQFAEPPVATIRQIPFVGSVAAGTGVMAAQNDFEMMSIPDQFAGRGESFVLQVRGDSMLGAGILPGDFLVVERQSTAEKGQIVVAGIPGDEATVKRYFPQGSRVVLQPENPSMEPMEFPTSEVVIYGRVISVLRTY
ncbi:MAG: transcriptional repressor LexA [Acidobacteria bacterium]|nr:transcriptional repressor LexA [Acidobacteriota bacterium]